MGWLFDRYRAKFAAMGYNYPPYYMMVVDLGQALIIAVAVIQRLVVGVSGWQWLAVIGAVCVGLAPHVAILIWNSRPILPVVPLSYIGAVALLWLVPVHGDVAPLILCWAPRSPPR